MKFLKWLWKHLFIIIIATVVTIFMGYLAIRWIRYSDTYLYRYLFQDSNGKFAWTGFTAIIAIITLAINAWDNRRKFRADLISKSRIAWISEMEQIVTEYISLIEKTEYDVGTWYYFRTLQALKNANKEIFGDFGGIDSKVSEAITLLNNNNHKLEIVNLRLRVSISDSEDNDLINAAILETMQRNQSFNDELEKEFEAFREKLSCDKEAGNFNKKYYKHEEIEKKFHVLPKDVLAINKNLTIVARRYFKEEWEKAKRGE